MVGDEFIRFKVLGSTCTISLPFSLVVEPLTLIPNKINLNFMKDYMYKSEIERLDKCDIADLTKQLYEIMMTEQASNVKSEQVYTLFPFIIYPDHPGFRDGYISSSTRHDFKLETDYARD